MQTIARDERFSEAAVRTMWAVLGLILCAVVAWGVHNFARAHWPDMQVARPESQTNLSSKTAYDLTERPVGAAP